MDVRNTAGGSLQISLEVVAKIARLAALEVDDVAEVSSGSNQSVRGLLSKTNLQKDVDVEMKDGVAVVSAICGQANPVEATRELARAVQSARS